MTIQLKDTDIKTIRRLNAVINGSIGGSRRTRKKVKASIRNVRKATKARIAIAA